MSKRILLLDSYDSFTYNLVQQVRELSEHDVTVVRNDEIEVVEAGEFDAFILSPGPGLPNDSGVLKAIIETYARSMPMFGVCLGMQAMAEVFDGSLFNLEKPLHGVSTPIELMDDSMFRDIPLQVKVGRYHSWAVKHSPLPAGFISTGFDEADILMAMRHKELPLFAVQFHPESILTEHGGHMIKNFLDII